ncbi:hypothetical protein H6G50_14705 [Oscillatoria sp. FACHB-1406]|nr:hypothetical protein [Oscillatoria sp. FACHB-1406]
MSSLAIATSTLTPAFALPPPEDIPEEVLRNEIATEARSLLNGEPLTAAEYAELRDRLQQRGYPPEVSSKLRELIFLLQIRRLINTVSPVPLL